ncbi:CoA transferase [Neobacillus citreus]|uniref:CoA transferase n=1 Tax=Neobacillus citreus TaxID=2833578 RepID=A0A942T0Q7_9BACI|nr:CoA transferase [Neobacillus citreus]MCH6267273.1 CoA transferase [Neobacillus citreus]
MAKGLETELLIGLRILELTAGPSGGYAGRLFAESGAAVTKIRTSSTSTSIFRDSNKVMVETTCEKEFTETVIRLLKEQWDIILWDSHISDDTRRLLTDLPKTCIGICIQFPSGVDSDEEYALQALGGWMSLTGAPDFPPMNVGGYPAAYLVGAHAATAGLLGLVERGWSGKGRFVQIHALTIAVSALEGAFSTCLATGISRGRTGNRHNKLAPMTILPALDGWAFVGAPVDEKWELLARWAELPLRNEWLNNEGRKMDCSRLEEELGNWSRRMTREELFMTGQALRLPFSKAQTVEEVLACPHLDARGVWEATSSKIIGMRLPWKVNKGPVPTIKQGTFFNKPSWKGLRILDLTGMWSGPYCTRIFADLGAKVIKVEAPHRPDGIRSNQGSSAPFFRELNRNKLGVQLDLRLPSDRQQFLELVKVSDVLVENFSPRVMPNFQLSKEELWKHRPDLTMVSLSAFGQTGPYCNFVGYGPTLEAMSGMAALTNHSEAEEGPWLPGFSVSDIGAGIHGAFALAAALLFRMAAGSGIQIDASQYETACQFTADYILNQKIPEKPRTPISVNGINELANDGQILRLMIDGGPPVLGMPWSSPDWEAQTFPPPALGQHTDEVIQLVGQGASGADL